MKWTIPEMNSHEGKEYEKKMNLLSFLPTRGRLPWTQRLSYGVGHILNDLTATIWFSYLMVYLQFVLAFDTFLAGLVLMVGQIADAVTTPLIGYEGDVAGGSPLCLKYGRRKCLHLVGTVAVMISFPFIFFGCPGCPGYPSNIAMFVLIFPLVCVFQFGWAATQVAHLSLIPDLTEDKGERDLLNIIRYSFSVVANIMVYVIAWLVFDFVSTGVLDKNKIGIEDAPKFWLIALIITAIGTIFSIVFLVGVKETAQPIGTLCRRIENVSSRPSSPTNGIANITLSSIMTWRDWMKEPKFYQIALLYTTTRLFQNFINVFTPLYLQESLGAHQDFMAKIPLVINCSGFASSLVLKHGILCLGKKASYVLGVLFGVSGCVWIAIDHGYPFCANGIYGVAVLLGIGSSVMVVCSVSYIPDLIGTNVESGAYVYGVFSFFDKMASGFGILLVQFLHGAYCDKICVFFYRYALAYGAGGMAVLSALIVLTINAKTLTHRSKGNDVYSVRRLRRTKEELNHFDKGILIEKIMDIDFEENTPLL